MTFPDLPTGLAEALAQRGYDAPTPVQAAVLEPEAHGRDLVVSAQTGSGKTVAFGLAFAAQVLGEDGRVNPSDAPSALVIAPTRELALQVSRELAWLYQKAGARIATCVGGMNPSQERRVLKSGATIVVGTPGRLRDHLERGALDLSALAAVVLDEADEMLDMGFREELEEILDATPNTRRTLLFSATMPRPIEALAKRYQRNALRIATTGAERGHGDIAYQAVTVSPSEIENAVVNLLRFHEAETAILFCATRDKVRHLHATLQERGFAAVALSGEHSQSERNQALQALRDKRARVCVATDVASRGIDLPSLSLVIHVEIPRDAEILQHRSGRTGRAGKKGTAVIVVPFPRRRRVESMLRHAKINAEWIDVPDRDAILGKDRERLLEALLQPIEVQDGDRELADRLLAERTPQEIAALLVQAHRAKMPEPEEMLVNSAQAHRADQKERHRPGFEDTVWFRMDIGRRQNADPRWVLPLLCRRGHITRNEIGAIRIGPQETHFQIPRTISDKFAEALVRTAGDESNGGDVTIELSPEAPRDAARARKKGAPNAGRKGSPYVKKHRKGNAGPGKPKGGKPGNKPGGDKRGK
ncbi:DEAD/DEAH box helicase [Aurantiacibacter atlanticus]|uniref:DEAD/DEAH box helicase n=1 Tax=Aurantiacibacter atlanticus TaxID=1648404 RepID=A0A0H4VEK7_9SPHN|nr:DEAD/DEAH box helicase [Aurantiacibacter atlanticus]AKQ42790.1 DEAD/DEAH box helicase [Aurantiacibacter atlanticus]MDF1835017.1 DEAD/DEAH box helicase [Alteraurantiacibacter sp. bin_em_oilr2.035]